MGAAAPRRLRVLVTGADGFVGRHLTALLRQRGHEVVGADRHGGEDGLEMDVRDPLAVRGAVELVRPDAIAHLAAQAFVPTSIEDPGATFAINAGGTLYVLEAAKDLASPGVRVVVASTGDVYGAHSQTDYPLTEIAATFPRSPYAASKLAAEGLAVAYAHTYGLDVVITRAFNHIGPGQGEHFAVPAFAAQLARVAAGQASTVYVGNLDARRDFLDVRDVCFAYALLLEGAGRRGETYNIATGVGTSLKEILRRLITIAGVPVEIREDPKRLRHSDVPLSIGSAQKLRDVTGWTPAVSLSTALRAVYDEALDRAQRSAAT